MFGVAGEGDDSRYFQLTNLPTVVVNLLGRVVSNAFVLNLVEGVLRIALFLGYIAAISHMEEIHTVMAAGAGSITKIVAGNGRKPVRAANVSDIRQYIERLPEMINKIDHDQRDHHLRARGDTQDEGACDGILKEGLKQEAG